jgi:pSer/pThr/pTyr-binding forkhead associated (FHA) protein
MRARLIPLDGGPSLELTKDMTLVGRAEDCDITLDHKSVSKQHCVLVKTDGLVLVRDLGSTNGTRVNGQRVRRAALLPNDNLAIANFKYQVKFGEDPNGAKSKKKDDATSDKPVIQVNELPDNYTT